MPFREFAQQINYGLSAFEIAGQPHPRLARSAKRRVVSGTRSLSNTRGGTPYRQPSPVPSHTEPGTGLAWSRVHGALSLSLAAYLR